MALLAAGDWNSLDGGCCDALDSALNPDDRSFGSADKRSGVDVGVAAVAERRESVAVAVEMGVSSGGRILEAAGKPARAPLGGVDGGRSSHLVEQEKTWE